MAGSGRLADPRLAELEVDDLLGRVRDGDMDAYGELYTRYSDFASRVARRVSRRHADDLVSESFRRILVTMQRGGGPTNGFGPYLATVIRSVGAGQALPFEETELGATHEVPVEQPDVDPRVSTAYLSLPQQWQDAIWYTDVEGLKPRQAAPLMGLPSANAFSALRKRARTGLRSAYLTQVVDDACNEEVRQALWMMAEGVLDPEFVDDVVDRHLDECDRCAAVAWRIAAVPTTGLAVGLGLAPAVLIFHGFAPGAALLPAGASVGAGLLTWLLAFPRRLWRLFVGSSTVATGAVTAATIVVVAVAATVVAGGDQQSASPSTTTTASVAETASQLREPSLEPSPSPSPSPPSSPPPATTALPVAVPVPGLALAVESSSTIAAPTSVAPVTAAAPAQPAAGQPAVAAPSPNTTTAPPTTELPPVPAPTGTAATPDNAVPAEPAPTTAPTTMAPTTTAPAAPTTAAPTTAAPTTAAPPPPATAVEPPPTTAPPTTAPPTTAPPTMPPTTSPAQDDNCFQIGRLVICLPPGVPWPPPWWPPGS